MAITFPGFRTRTPRHKAIDEVERLRHQLKGAGLLIKGLRLQVEEAERALDQANTRANTLAEADSLRARAEQQMAATAAELTALRQFKANVQSIDVAPGVRDIDPGNEVTQPVPIVVKTLAEAFGQGRTNTSPGHVPAWATAP